MRAIKRKYYLFCIIFPALALAQDLYSNAIVEPSNDSEAEDTLKGSEAFSRDQQDDQATEKSMVEIQKTLEEYEWKISTACPNTVKLLNDPTFLTPIMPTLTTKFLTRPENASILKTFFRQIPFLRINDQPISPAYMSSLNDLAKGIASFIEQYTRAKKSIHFQQREYAQGFTGQNKSKEEHIARVANLATPIIGILGHAETSLSQIRKNLLYQGFYAVSKEESTAKEAFNRTKMILSFLNTLLNWDVFQEVKMKLLSDKEDSTIGRKLRELLSESILQQDRGLESEKSNDNSSQFVQHDLDPIQQLKNAAQSLSKFSEIKVPASTELADKLDQQGHIVFKIIKTQDPSNPTAPSKITIRFFDPTEKGRYTTTRVGVTEILFPKGVALYLKTMKTEFNELREAYRVLQSKSNALVAIASAGSGISANAKSATRLIEHKPAEQKVNTFSQEILIESQYFLKRVKALQYKIDFALKLEILGDYDLTHFPHGLYIFVNPNLHFGQSHSIKELVTSLQFKSGKTVSTRKSRLYSMSYSTWDKMPSRSRVNVARSVGQFVTALGTSCRFDSLSLGAKVCETNLSNFLASVRYCKLGGIGSCINSATGSPEVKTILGNFYDYLESEAAISQTSEKSSVVLTTSVSLEDKKNDDRQQFITDPMHKQNLVWLIILVELLQREMTLDRDSGFRNNREVSLYLEKILIDAAYHISSIANNAGFSFLSARALNTFRQLTSMPPQELANKRNEFIDNIEVAQKMQLLNISNEVNRIHASMKEIQQEANSFGRTGTTISRVTSTMDAIRNQDSRLSLEDAIAQTAVREIKQSLSQGLPEAESSEKGLRSKESVQASNKRLRVEEGKESKKRNRDFSFKDERSPSKNEMPSE